MTASPEIIEIDDTDDEPESEDATSYVAGVSSDTKKRSRLRVVDSDDDNNDENVAEPMTPTIAGGVDRLMEDCDGDGEKESVEEHPPQLAPSGDDDLADQRDDDEEKESVDERLRQLAVRDTTKHDNTDGHETSCEYENDEADGVRTVHANMVQLQPAGFDGGMYDDDKREAEEDKERDKWVKHFGGLLAKRRAQAKRGTPREELSSNSHRGETKRKRRGSDNESDANSSAESSEGESRAFHAPPFAHHSVDPPKMGSVPFLDWQQNVAGWKATEEKRVVYERLRAEEAKARRASLPASVPSRTDASVPASSKASATRAVRRASLPPAAPSPQDESPPSDSPKEVATQAPRKAQVHLRPLFVHGDYAVRLADGTREWRSHSTDPQRNTHASGPVRPPLRRYPVIQGYRPTGWPFDIVHLAENYNPSAVSFPYVAPGGRCRCRSSCRMNTCINGQLRTFCTPASCPFEGMCGNGIQQSASVQLMRHRGTNELAVVAIDPIDAGVVLGQYLGELSLVNASEHATAVQRGEGYRLLLARDSYWRNKRVCIDASKFGSLMRFVDHSCRPSTQFYQVSNGSRHTIVVATCRAIQAGEVITAYFGDQLWFECACGECPDSSDDDDGCSEPPTSKRKM